MKSTNLFTQSALMSKKAVIVAKSETKKDARETLAVFATALASEFGRLTKSESKLVRDCINAMRSKYPANTELPKDARAVRQSIDIVAACYPYQTTDGVLLSKCTEKDEDGNVIRKYWGERKLTAAAARSIVLACVNNYTNTIGAPVVERHEVDETI